jgi:Flagellar biosynthesis/type III secretory pathway lipoprotein
MLATDYERKQYENMQLQERLGASIKTLSGVKEAIVTISVPTENVFYLQETESTTASVIIHLEPGATLTRQQIAGIQNLVIKSVSGLTAENIALTDGEGNDLVNNLAAENGGEAKLKLTNAVENALTQKVNKVLDGPYTQEQYKVAVTATLNTDAIKQESTVYTPSEDGENSGVINQESSSLVISNEDGIAGGIAGVTGNTDITTYAEGLIGDGGIVTGINENTTYSVSQEITQTEKLDPAIETVSIGIAIDDPAMTPVARENLIQLVAFAAGVPPASVTVRNFEFAQLEEEVDEPLFTPQQLLVFGGIGAGVLLLLLVLLFILSRGKKKKAAGKDKKKGKRGKGIDEAFATDEDSQTDDLFGALAADHLESIEQFRRLKMIKKKKSKSLPPQIRKLRRSYLSHGLKMKVNR